MTTINESQTAKGFTPAALVPAAFAGRKRTIESITIHHWGVTGQTHDNVVRFFVSGPGTTSAHFVASEGRIDCLVSPEDVAWHTGNLIGNTTSIGLELRPEASPGDYSVAAELVRFLRDQYGDLPLVPHRAWHNTACPGIWDLVKLDKLARGSAAVDVQGTTTTQESKVTPAQMQELKVFMQAEINKSINAMWASDAVIQRQINQLADGINNVKAGSVDTAELAKAVNDDLAKRIQN